MTLTTYLIGCAVTAWLIGATLTYAVMFADFQGACPSLAEESRREDMGFALLMGGCAALVFGPVVWFAVLCITGFARHGIKFW